jgi:hypothetical protein
MSWAGLDRLARIAKRLELESRVAYWRTRADKVRAEVLERAWSTTHGAFAASFGGDALDSTALLLPELGLVDARDPRFVATVSAIERLLKDGDWLYRYRHHDDFGRPDTSFSVCAFWYVNALAMMGRRDEARAHFERLLAQRTRLGLLSEDIDASSGEWWGNFPQTYSLGIINSAIRLSRPRRSMTRPSRCRTGLPRRREPRAPGGIHAAMRSQGGMWLGWSGSWRPTTRRPSTHAADNVELATFDLPRHDFDLYYAGFCNGTLGRSSTTSSRGALFTAAIRRLRPRQPAVRRAALAACATTTSFGFTTTIIISPTSCALAA